MLSNIGGKYKLSRRGRKLIMADDARTLMALPKDVPERIWAEILQKEEDDLMILDIREEILDDALAICFVKYMQRQTALFTAHCAAQAWLKLIDWHFYRHDPGEDPSAYPPCYIPKRRESWIPDELPDPSPKDSWCRQDLIIQEEWQEEGLKKWPSSSSIDMPLVEDISSEYWFPGKVNLPIEPESDHYTKATSNGSSSVMSEPNICAESEVLQKVTDYSTEDLSIKESTYSALKTTTPVEGSLHGAGDSIVDRLRPKRKATDKSKVFSRPSIMSRSKNALPPLIGDSRSRISIISDCRLRNLRLDAQYEITSEKIDTPPGEIVKRK
ncbi:uncharacterized protein LOC125060830 [Pieris napi]|uniref:uncharacterized protein LOC125060830 n=1 Tax=Pieris napi TaxID=78633 RepID=UPI001FBA6C01|nr:uncharacterized protein LOC125060830 [Pieris napi]